MQKSKSETVRKEDSKNSTVKGFLSEHKAELSIAGGIACAAVLVMSVTSSFRHDFGNPSQNRQGKWRKRLWVPKSP